MGIRCQGKVGDACIVDVLAEGVECCVWEGGDVVCVDDEEGVGGFDGCWS